MNEEFKSQNMSHMCDRQTDGWTDGRTDGQTDKVIPIWPPTTRMSPSVDEEDWAWAGWNPESMNAVTNAAIPARTMEMG